MIQNRNESSLSYADEDVDKILSNVDVSIDSEFEFDDEEEINFRSL